MRKTAIPSAYPAAGVFEFSTIHVDLSCAMPGTKVYYTLDGSTPTAESPVYVRADGLLPLRGVHGEDVTRTIRAFAVAEGCAPSDVVTFTYRFCCPPKGVFRHQLLRELGEEAAALIRIEDFDLDKMYLVVGTERAVLVDGGWDAEGDLPGLCRALIGRDIPIDLVIAHGHPDHIAQIHRFLEAGCEVYLPHADLEAAKNFGYDIDPATVHDIAGDTVFNLGCTTLRSYLVSGHTPGGIVLLDEKTGDLFASDELGSNRRYVPDTAWLQLSSCSLESCLTGLNAFLKATEGKLTRIFTGHNDEILNADAYLAVLKQALENAVNLGNDALTPSLRSAVESFGSGTATIVGDWRLDPIWAGANVQFIYEADRLAVPPRYARGFDPTVRTSLD